MSSPDSIAILLAAGRSTRMNSELPKPLHTIAGKPMLAHLLDAAAAGGVKRVVLVVGHGREQVEAAFGHHEHVAFVEQTQMLGTGHAVMACREVLNGLPPEADVTILAGDLPLVTGDHLHALRNAHQQEHADATLGTGVVDDPTGYGRILRDDAGDFVGIVEQLDATDEQREIREVFPSLYCVKAEALLFALDRLSNDNAKGEYYLTDIYSILREHGRKVLAVETVTAEDVIAPNDRRQLAEAEAVMQARIHDALRGAGVTVVHSDATYVEADVEVGPDTTILPFTFIGRGTTIGRGCTVGPHAHLEPDSVVPDGSTVTGLPAAR